MQGLALNQHNPCDACATMTDAAQLNFTAEGQRLCRTCHGTYVSMKATERARRAEEYRRCSQCGSTVRPVVEMMEDEDGDPSLFAALRAYHCRCGHHFSTLSTTAMVLNSVLLAVGCYFAGQGWRHEDFENLLAGSVLAIPAMVAMLWDAWVRHFHPRVVGAT